MKVIRKVIIFLFKLGALRLGGRNFRIRVSSDAESFAQAVQILNYSNTKDTKGAPQLITPLFQH